jgi:hypothetical protein
LIWLPALLKLRDEQVNGKPKPRKKRVSRMTGAAASQSRANLLPHGISECPIGSIQDEWRSAARSARRAGWAIFVNGTGKLEWRGPDGQKVIVPHTGRRRGHTAQNYLKELQRAGVPGA